MDFSFKVEGLDRINKSFPGVAREVDKELKKAVFASGKYVEAEAKKSILSGEKTGRIYKRGSVEHRASAPGEAPASDTGRLVNSISTYLNDLTAFVVAGRGLVKYARMLEFGTSKMAARPFLFPAVERSRGWIQERLNKAVRTAVIRVSKK